MADMPPKNKRKSEETWLRRHARGLLGTFAAVLTVLAFFTGVDSLPQVLDKLTGTAESPATTPSEGEGTDPSGAAEPAPGDPAEPGPGNPAAPEGEPVPSTTHTVMLETIGSNPQGYAAQLTIDSVSQGSGRTLIHLTIESDHPQPLGYIYEVVDTRNGKDNERDRFELLMPNGNTHRQTGQRGIFDYEASEGIFRLYCLPLLPNASASFTLEFDGVQLGQSATLVHVAEDRSDYRRCADATVTFSHFRVQVQGATG